MYIETASREFFIYFYKLKNGKMNPARIYHLWILTDAIILKSEKYRKYLKFSEDYFIIRLSIFKHMLKLKITHTQNELRMAGFKYQFKLITEDEIVYEEKEYHLQDISNKYFRLISESFKIIQEFKYS